MNTELHPHLLEAQKLLFEPSGWFIDEIVQEIESETYGAFQFEMNRKRILFRVAKVTPKKIGQFVTLWKRVGKAIVPYDILDPVDLFVISVRKNELFGQFVFPKAVLCEKGFVSREGRRGKLAMRLYPPWDTPSSQQAKNTQVWQLAYFLEIDPSLTNSTRMEQLYRS